VSSCRLWSRCVWLWPCPSSRCRRHHPQISRCRGRQQSHHGHGPASSCEVMLGLTTLGSQTNGGGGRSWRSQQPVLRWWMKASY
jgi:hypothetical protein